MQDSEAVAMLHTMAKMQETHNIQVHPQWRSQGYAYYRAIWVECAEMLDHFGWKWWKHQVPDVDQVKLELVDIWHFGLSELIRADTLDDAMASDLALVKTTGEPDPVQFRSAIEDLAMDALQSKSFALPPFIAAMASLPMGYQELFDMYVGKNVLNQFRQAHGYQDGTYRKVWRGKEDNEHLVELLAELDGSAEELPDRLSAALKVRYQQDQ
jgi:dimeric dUTPase (all-alpha-NTP-PPase superfamily)